MNDINIIRFNVTGAERKRLADYIAGFLGCKKEYLGAPSFAYKVGYFEVSRDGEVTFEEHPSLKEEVTALMQELEQEGFHAEGAETPHKAEDKIAGEQPQSPEQTPQETPVRLTVSIPLENVSVGNLTNLLEAKGSLIKKALGVNDLPFEIGEDAVTFPWLDDCPDATTAKAYTDFIAAVCRMSVEQTRINAIRKEVTNEKYAFRCFLLRLGFIGSAYKADRKILLRNLEGSSAFKTAKEVASDAVFG